MRTPRRIVLSVVALVCTGLAGVPSCKADSDRRMVTQSSINIIAEVLYTFRHDVGRFPTSAEGLRVLAENASSLATWQGPYVDPQVQLVDSWMHDLRYVTVGDGESAGVCVYSVGVNGTDEAGSGDDIASESCASVIKRKTAEE